MSDITVIVEPSSAEIAVTVTPAAVETAITLETGAPGPQGPAGPDGAPGSDASVTSENIASALGFTPDSPASTRPPSSHTHPISQVTGLQSALDGKQAAGSYATAAQGALADTALQDAPSDGTQYARKDGAWDVVASGNPFDQNLNTTDSPTFDSISIGNILSAPYGNFYSQDYYLHYNSDFWVDGFLYAAGGIGSSGNCLNPDGSASFSSGAATIDSSGNITAANLPTSFFSGAYGDLTGTPTFAAVATSGSATDLTTGTLDAARLPSSVARLTANTFTAAQTIASGTLTASAPALAITQTWNNSATTFSAATINVTDTASAAASRLLDLQVGGTSRFFVNKSGFTTLVPAGNTTAYSIEPANFAMIFRIGGTSATLADAFAIRPTGIHNISTGTIGWASASVGSGSQDLILAKDASNTLAQRNGTNAQTFRAYNTYTDASNYERGFFRWNANVLQVGCESGGTGAARTVAIAPNGATNPIIFASSTGTHVDVTQCRSLSTGANMVFGPGTTISGWTATNYASGSADPTTSTITSGNWQVHRNTTTGVVKLWANNAGTLVSVALT